MNAYFAIFILSLNNTEYTLHHHFNFDFSVIYIFIFVSACYVFFLNLLFKTFC